MATAVASTQVRVKAPATIARVAGIDMLRGLSIVAVVIHHINLRIRINKTPLGEHLPRWAVSFLGWNGYNGVIVFFAISGFLITTTCLRRWGRLSDLRIADFYRLRFARIVPMLVAVLLALSALHLMHVGPYVIDAARSTLPRALFAAATLHINWLEAQRGYLPANWDVLWSLSNEEMFYLFFPVLCVVLRKRAALIAALCAFIAIGPFARTVLSQNELWRDYGYLSCMDAIAIGCIAAMVANAVALSELARRALLIVGGSLMTLVLIVKPWTRALGLYKAGLDVTVLAVGTALVLVAFQQRDMTPTRWSAPLRWFGRNSYEVYLTHMMAIFAILPLVTRYDAGYRFAPVWYMAMVALAGVLGGVIARIYSEPMNRKLRKTSAHG